MSFKIQEAEPKHHEEILNLVNRTVRETWSGIIPKDEFRDPFLTADQFEKMAKIMTFYMYKEEESMLAAFSFSIAYDNTGWIPFVHVLPEHQNRGIGTTIMSFLEEHARERGLTKMKLETNEGAEWAIRFYTKLGYQIVEKYQERSWGYDVWMEKAL